MTPAAIAPALRDPSPVAAEITVLVVADRQSTERIETAFDDDDRLAIRTAPSISNALSALDDVDCLVGAYPPENGTGLVDRVADRAPDLPVVLLVDGTAAVGDAVKTHRWIDWLERPGPGGIDGDERLGHRIRTLVERRRLDGLARRSLAGIELAGDAIAVVAPDGTLQFANRAFAMQFGYDPDDLSGRSWRTLFTDDSVDRLETTAVPTVADGWRWTGTCTGRRRSGATVPVRVRLGGSEDGSLVFVVETADGGAGAAANEE